MAQRWYLKPKFLVFAPLLLIAVACGAEATPVPQSTATPQPVAPTATPPPTATPQPILSPTDIASLVSEAVKGAVPPPAEVVSAAEIRSLIETAIAAAAPKGATAEDVKTLVDAGVAAVKAEAISKEEVAAQVSKAITEATAKLPKPVSAGEIEKIVKAAIPATPTPAPTATPAPALDPRALVIAARYGSVVPMAALETPRGFDPHVVVTVESLSSFGPLYNQVLEYNPVNPTELIGDLAKSWEVSDDGLTYTFRLHENVKWSDGQDLTADDVEFSLNRMIAEGETRPNTGRLRSYVDRVEKVDRNTVKVHLKFPSLAFLAFLGVDFFKVMPKHVLDAGVDIDVFENAVGSGPFKFVSYTQGDVWEVAKNTDYFKEGLPYFDGMKHFIIVDKGAEIAAYKTERVLMDNNVCNHLDVEDIVRLKNDESFTSRFDVFSKMQAAAEHVLLNTRVPPFDDERVRRAFFLALDRQEIVDGFGLGTWVVTGPMFPRSIYSIPRDELLKLPGYRQLDGKKHPDDIAEANRLMAEAGYGPDDPQLKIRMDVAQIVQFPDISQVAIAQYEKFLGVDIDIVLADIGAIFTRYIAGDFQMGMFGIGSQLLDPDDGFGGIHLDTDRNYTGWTNARVTELFNLQQRESDITQRIKLNREMQLITLTEDTTGYLWTLSKGCNTIVNKRIRTEVGPYVQTATLYTVLKHEHEWLLPK